MTVGLRILALVLASVFAEDAAFAEEPFLRRQQKGFAYVAGSIGISHFAGSGSLAGSRTDNIEDCRLTGGFFIPGLRCTPVSATVTQRSAPDLQLTKNSLAYGLKLGGYREHFGAELEFFTTAPHIRQQTVRQCVNAQCVDQVSAGSHFQVYTLGLTGLYRFVNDGPLQPYIGVGPALYMARWQSAEDSFFRLGVNRVEFSPGVNAQLGLRWLFSSKFSLFAEYKLNWSAPFEFTSDKRSVTGCGSGLLSLVDCPGQRTTTQQDTSVTVNYLAHVVSFGIAMHFY